MKTEQELLEEYRKQIDACTNSLALAKNDQVQGFLGQGMTLDQVKMFTDGNLDKRFTKLSDQMEFVVEYFEEEDFGNAIEEYVRTVPLAAYDTGCTDGENFLLWLRKHRELTPEQLDVVNCQRTRHAVEFVARDNRLGHVRFQELHSMVEQNLDQWGENPDLWIHLNPIHVWTTFHTTVMLEEDDEVPATILFYALDNDIRTAILEPEGEALVRFLKENGPSKLDELVILCPDHERDDLIETGRDLAEMGLAAFG